MPFRRAHVQQSSLRHSSAHVHQPQETFSKDPYSSRNHSIQAAAPSPLPFWPHRKRAEYDVIFAFYSGDQAPPTALQVQNRSTTPRTGTACSSPLTSQAPFIQLITTLLSPRTSQRQCVPDGHATFQGSLSSRGLFERSTGGSQALEDSGGFKFSMTCQEYSNSFVSESHSVHVLQAFSFGIQASPKNRVKGRSQ